MSPVMHTATLLLGLISGHFDEWSTARTTGDIFEVETAINSGVGIVTPVEAICEAIELETAGSSL
ncbi:MAG: hypothetical protein JJE05_11510 [Actinobacteria bacterium]|nr:hypothetical protein [Actinomycetota bacterium]